MKETRMSGENKTWRERIAEARKRGEFTREDLDNAYNWLTCACAEQHAAMPLVVAYARPLFSAAPEDDELFWLGGQFDGAVKSDDFDRAEHILDAIEDRALELKRASGASQPEGLRP